MKHAGYNPPQRMTSSMRLVFAMAAVVWLLPAAHAANWEKPAADLAKQIAGLAGPGPARLVLRNNSILGASEIPAIRRLLERDLRGYGILPGTSDSATLIRVTLSENLRGGLWVAEVEEGTETRLAMLPVSLTAVSPAGGSPNITLGRTLVLTQTAPVLDAVLFSADGEQRLVVLEPERIVVYVKNSNLLVATTGAAAAGTGNDSEWAQIQTFDIPHTRAFPRDVRGRLFSAQDHLFDAYLPGVACSGSNAGAQVTIACSDSDDPWPVAQSQRAFYNSMRDYYTGVLAPGLGMDLPAFYEAATLPRPSGPALLLTSVNSNVMLVENNAALRVNGTADWGSDLAVVHSSCGTGAQVLVPGTGAAAGGDSLRAYEIPGREAIPVSAPLPVDGAVMAMESVADATSATVIVRREQPARYEVWNVAALCN